VPHTIERAITGRAKCRGCGDAIPAGTLRFGERIPNTYGDAGGETTQWYHVRCGALTRPDAFLEALNTCREEIDEREWLEREAALGAAHERLPRARAAERAPTGRASCRSCRELISKEAWRIAVAYYEEGRFVPGGFIHASCAQPFFGTKDILPRLKHFSPGLSQADLSELGAEIGKGGP
jgi:hypothetical protein